MSKIHQGATLTPPFREFLPRWLGAAPWYRGSGTPQVRQVGCFRFEDPDGRVGIETHLVTDGTELYQLPMTYRAAPLPDAPPGSLVAQSEHSVLGTRWIYDATVDPAWRERILWLVATEGESDVSQRSGAGPARATGRRHVPAELIDESVRIEVRRVITDEPADQQVAGVVLGTWDPLDSGPAGGLLAVLRRP